MLITVAVLAVIALAFGDAATAAVIAAIAGILNNFINLHNARQIHHTKAIITSPREMVYDETGKPVGTIPLEGPMQGIPTTSRRENDDAQ